MINSSINTKFSNITQEQNNQNQLISELTKQISILRSKIIILLQSSPKPQLPVQEPATNHTKQPSK